jgi:hypothetical protein
MILRSSEESVPEQRDREDVRRRYEVVTSVAADHDRLSTSDAQTQLGAQ